MRIIFLIATFLTFSSGISSPTLTTEQDRQLRVCAEAYISAIQKYSNGEDQSQRINITSNLFNSNIITNSTLRKKHFNDLSFFLSREEQNDNNEDEPISTYLRMIDEKFDCKLTVEFSKINTINCVDGNDGVISLEKKITYKGITKSFIEIILVSLPQNEIDGGGYKISQVLSAENYKGNDNVCGNSVDVDKDEIEIYRKKKDADNYFSDKDYLNAKKLYEFILSKNPNDTYSREQIALCKKFLTRDDYLNKGNVFFNRQEFEIAQYWYQRLLGEYPNDSEKDKIQNKIDASKRGIVENQYRSNINKADAAISSNEFNEARFYYEQALQIKPRDVYAASGLERAKVQDDRYANSEIERVVRLAGQGNKYYGEYFRVLMRYEGYGNHIRLGTKQYYNMVLMLNSYDSHVMKEMHFRRRDCRQYCKIYCKKLNDRYFSESDPNLRADIRNLLNRAINENNQN